MKKIEYTFKEFCDHVHAMSYVLGYECVSRGAEQVEIGAEHCFELNALRVMDYMQQCYADRVEQRHKGKLLQLMMMYIAEHIQEFDKAHYAYDSGNLGEPSFLSHSLLRAVHHVFTSRSLSELGHGPTTEEIIKLAERFKEEEKASNKGTEPIR